MRVANDIAYVRTYVRTYCSRAESLPACKKDSRRMRVAKVIAYELLQRANHRPPVKKRSTKPVDSVPLQQQMSFVGKSCDMICGGHH